MGYEYAYDLPAMAPEMDSTLGGVLGVMLGFFLVFYLLVLAFSVVCYILHSLGLYTIAKRRQIRHPWLSWLPVGNMWILGSISDQYQYVTKGRIRNRRKVLLGLMIAVYALSFFVLVTAIAALLDFSGTGMFSGLTVLAELAMLAVSLTASVIMYMALYDLYISCDHCNAVMYLVLSIFISVTMPFFVFACRKKDLGMPPRKTVQQEQPVAQPLAVQASPEQTPAEEIHQTEE